MQTQRVKEICLGILVVLIYFLGSELANPLANALQINLLPEYLVLSWQILYEIVLILIIILLLNKKIINDINDIKKNHKKYFKENFKYYLIGLAVMLISNIIIIFILGNGISNNEQGIRDTLNVYPIYIYITGVLLAPLLEELVFRQGFYNIFKNKYLFILTSGLVFGGLHVVTSLTSLIDLLYLIPYCSLGIAFAYILYKTNNIFVTSGLHFMHNGILIALQFVLMIFG